MVCNFQFLQCLDSLFEGIINTTTLFFEPLASLIYTDYTQLSNTINVGVEVYDTSINAAALISLSEVPFMKFPMQYMSNMNCWLSLIPRLQSDGSNERLFLETLGISPSNILLTFECISCSPEFQALTEYLKSWEVVQEVTTMMNQVLDYLSDEGRGELVQGQLDQILTNAHKDYDCPNNSQNIMRQDPHLSHTAFDPNMEVGLQNIHCSEINVTDIKVTYNQVNISLFELSLAVTDLDIQCELDWK